VREECDAANPLNYESEKCVRKLRCAENSINIHQNNNA
jgi:hypothetical protein